MTNRVNEHGYHELAKHAVVKFELNSIVNVSLVNVWEHSILLNLAVEKTDAGFRLSFSAAYGVSGTIEAERLSLSITPGKPSPRVTALS